MKVRLADTRPAPHRATPARPHAAAPAAARPHLLRRVHHLVRPHGLKTAKPRPVALAEPVQPHRQYLESSLGMRSLPVYELRPTACDTQPAAAQSLAPGAAAPAAQKLLDAIAGPAPDTAPPTPALTTPVETIPDVIGPPPPDTAVPGPDVPGPDFPTFPGPGGPGGGFPVVVTPPPSGGPPGGPPGGAIPEPATWAMLLLGFFGLVAALRGRRPSALKP